MQFGSKTVILMMAPLLLLFMVPGVALADHHEDARAEMQEQREQREKMQERVKQAQEKSERIEEAKKSRDSSQGQMGQQGMSQQVMSGQEMESPGGDMDLDPTPEINPDTGCREGMVPITKMIDSTTACVFPESHPVLVQRGWGY